MRRSGRRCRASTPRRPLRLRADRRPGRHQPARRNTLDGGYHVPHLHQLDPEPATRLFAVRNPNFLADADRLYIGTKGFVQTDPDSADLWRSVGAVLSLSLDDPANPTWLRTLTLPQEVPAADLWWSVRGMEILPPEERYLGSDGNPNVDDDLRRNVLVIGAQDSRGPTESPVDRLVVAVDPE